MISLNKEENGDCFTFIVFWRLCVRVLMLSLCYIVQFFNIWYQDVFLKIQNGENLPN